MDLAITGGAVVGIIAVLILLGIVIGVTMGKGA
jgi:hypothetical protein